MNSNGKKDSTSSWQAKVHQIEFTPTQIANLKDMDQRTDSSLFDVLQSLIVDNAGFKVKSVEYFGSFTFSYTLDKHDPNRPGHTYWFYDTDIGRGIRVMAMFVEHILPDWTSPEATKEASGLW